MTSSSPLPSTAPTLSWLRKHSLGLVMNVGVALGGVILARLLNTITQIALARWMGVADFGLYTSLYTLLGPIVTIASLGLDMWLLRRGGDIATLDDNISRVFSLRLIATTLLMLVGVAAMLLSKQPELTWPLVVNAAIGLSCELWLVTAHTALRAQVRNIAGATLQAGVAGLTLAVIWLLWNQSNTVLAATTGRMLAGLVGLAWLIWLLRKSLHITWQPARLLTIIREARAFLASDILALITLKADLTLVALLLGTIAAGTYAPALLIINTTFLVPQVVWQVLLPIIARQEHASPARRRIVAAAIGGSLFYGLGWAVTFAFGAEFVMNLVYSQQYSDAIPLLRIMSIIPLLKSFNFCWAMLMIAYDAQSLRSKLQTIGAAVNVLGNIICIPLFGLAGASWIYVATESTLLIAYSWGLWFTVRSIIHTPHPRT